MDKRSLQSSKHFCILPWMHFQLSPTGDVLPCCRTGDAPYGSLQSSPLEEIWNGEKARAMRKELLADRPVQACQGCYQRERQGAESYRLEVLRDHAAGLTWDEVERRTAADGSVPLSKLEFLDLRPSNVCNFRCRTCRPEESSAWYPDAVSLGISHGERVLEVTNTGFDDLVEQTFPTVRKINIAGGEPLVLESHYRMLERLIELGRTDVELSYHTNLSVLRYREWEPLSLWKKFRKVEVGASADGAGIQGELLRKGFLSERFTAHYRELKRQGAPIFPHIHLTVSVMNIFHLTEALDRWIEEGLIQDAGDVRFGQLDGPAHLHLEILNEQERARVRGHFERYLESLEAPAALRAYLERELQGILRSFGPRFLSEERERFRSWMFALDKIRGERFVQVFPEHFELLYGE